MSIHHSKPCRSRTLVSLMLCSVLVSLAVLALSSSVRADPPFSNLIVVGTVYDSGGSPLEGATVVVTDTRTSASDSMLTLSGGFYTVTLTGGGGWDIGDTIRVVANAPGEVEKINSSVVPADIETHFYSMTIDVHFGTAIPQLGSSVGMAFVAGLVGLIAVVAVGVRRQ